MVSVLTEEGGRVAASCGVEVGVGQPRGAQRAVGSSVPMSNGKSVAQQDPVGTRGGDQRPFICPLVLIGPESAVGSPASAVGILGLASGTVAAGLLLARRRVTVAEDGPRA